MGIKNDEKRNPMDICVTDVILEKGPLENSRWRHNTQRAARARARALGELHNAEITYRPVLNEYVVHADRYYGTGE